MRDDRGILAIFCVLIGFLGFLYTECLRYKKATERPPVRDTVTVFDTVPFYYPKPRDSVVTRYVTDTLTVIQSDTTDTARLDSLPVIIPITSNTYEGDGWRAHVSGFRPQLDSLVLFPERQTITIRDPPATDKASNRWTLSVQAGYGITPRGMQPYLGVGLSWRFKLFDP